MKRDDIVKIDMGAVRRDDRAFGVPGRHWMKVIRQTLKYGDGKVKIVKIQGDYADVVADGPGAVLGIVSVPVRALKKASLRHAARSPDKTGRNWRELNGIKGHRWQWDGGDTVYWVRDMEGPGRTLYQLFMITPETGNRVFKQRPLKNIKDAFTIAAQHYDWLQTQAGMYNYPRMGWKTASLQPLRRRRDYGEEEASLKKKNVVRTVSAALRDIAREIMAEDAMQTIIVKKSHPDVESRADAQRIADKHGKVYTSRETGTSYRFRQRDDDDFVADSFRTEQRDAHVSVVWGELKKGKKAASRVPEYGDTVVPTQGSKYDIPLHPPKGKSFEELTPRDKVWWYEHSNWGAMWTFVTPVSNLKPAGGDGRWKVRDLGKMKQVSRTAAKWESLPKGWTDASRKKFWNSLTSGTVPERVKECIGKIEGTDIDDPGAFCASLADRIEGKAWRSEKRSSSEESLGLLKVACDVIHAGMTDLAPEALEEIRDDVLRALGGIPRKQRKHPKVKKMEKDVLRALSGL